MNKKNPTFSHFSKDPDNEYSEFTSKNINPVEIQKIKFSLERPQMILQVIENLEKLMFMNYNNFCISADNFNGDKSIPDDIDSIRQFFTQNEKVCKGWFMNIRKICIRVAIHCGKPSSAVYHCWKS